MKAILPLALLLATIGSGTQAWSQEDNHSGTPGPTMLVASNPKYPMLALSANITGDVVVRLRIRKDGAVESATVESGQSLLAEAALNSARPSRFECSSCSSEVTPFSVTYSYQLAAGPDWPCSEVHQHSIQSRDRVTIIGEPRIVDPYFNNVRSRSAKCLYLWECGSKWGGQDYYYYRFRGARCLGLWNCGLKLREPYARCRRLRRDVW
jgi:TonB family protein